MRALTICGILLSPLSAHSPTLLSTGECFLPCVPTARDHTSFSQRSFSQRKEVLASWYGQPFHNKPTASGAIFSRFALTCAHATLPFGSKLRLRNPLNGREITVEVTDRGPFFPGRDLDLSEMAAFKLGILRNGVASLSMEIQK